MKTDNYKSNNEKDVDTDNEWWDLYDCPPPEPKLPTGYDEDYFDK